MRSRKSSRCNICCRVTRLLRRITSSKFIFASHSPLLTISRSVGIENLEGLRAIRFGVRQNLLAGQLRPRHRTPARIADHGGEIADDQNRLVTEILELPQFSQHDRVTEMQDRR